MSKLYEDSQLKCELLESYLRSQIPGLDLSSINTAHNKSAEVLNSKQVLMNSVKKEKGVFEGKTSIQSMINKLDSETASLVNLNKYGSTKSQVQNGK